MRIIFFIGCLCLPGPLQAQDDVSRADKPWKTDVHLGLNIAQAAVSKAWKGGGSSSLTLRLVSNASAIYSRARHRWTNTAQLQYGFLNAPGQGGLRKNSDRIFLDSKYARTLTTAWNAFSNVTFLSQFGQGVNYNNPNNPVSSTFMAPGYLFESVGVEYAPVSYFAVQLGLATLRQTFVTNSVVQQDVPTNYGVDPGKTLLNQFGSQLVVTYRHDVVQNVNLNVRYGLFVAYMPQLKTPTHRLDLTATGRVNNFMNVNLTLIGIYDTDVADGLQLSEGLALGFAVSF